MSAPQSSTYSQGHHTAVTANHLIRTAERDGAFILSHLKPHYRILDIGCGPGSITAGFAKYVPQGSVTGLDLAPDVIKQAQEFLKNQASATEKRGEVSFEVGNVAEGLHFSDGTFDVVFCNQTLVHIPEPVKALQEMKRVCKAGGFVACREADFPFHFYPELPGFHLFQKNLWLLVHGGMPESSQTAQVVTPDPQRPFNTPHPPGHRSGSRIHVWARLAGFDPERIVKDASVEMIATQESRDVFAGNMISRIEKAGHREKFFQLGATEEDVDTILRDMQLWKNDQDACFSLMQCEVLCSV